MGGAVKSRLSTLSQFTEPLARLRRTSIVFNPAFNLTVNG